MTLQQSKDTSGGPRGSSVTVPCPPFVLLLINQLPPAFLLGGRGRGGGERTNGPLKNYHCRELPTCLTSACVISTALNVSDKTIACTLQAREVMVNPFLRLQQLGMLNFIQIDFFFKLRENQRRRSCFFF